MMTYLNVLYSHKAMEIATRKGRMKSVERKEGRININDSSFFLFRSFFLFPTNDLYNAFHNFFFKNYAFIFIYIYTYISSVFPLSIHFSIKYTDLMIKRYLIHSCIEEVIIKKRSIKLTSYRGHRSL